MKNDLVWWVEGFNTFNVFFIEDKNVKQKFENLKTQSKFQFDVLMSCLMYMTYVRSDI